MLAMLEGFLHINFCQIFRHTSFVLNYFNLLIGLQLIEKIYPTNIKVWLYIAGVTEILAIFLQLFMYRYKVFETLYRITVPIEYKNKVKLKEVGHNQIFWKYIRVEF